jgi:hypothetical protein
MSHNKTAECIIMGQRYLGWAQKESYQHWPATQANIMY